VPNLIWDSAKCLEVLFPGNSCIFHIIKGEVSEYFLCKTLNHLFHIHGAFTRSDIEKDVLLYEYDSSDDEV
jgi:hypothetical protein